MAKQSEMSGWPEPPQQIVVDDDVVLQPIFESSANALYTLIDHNRDYLGRFLDFATPEYSLQHAEKFIPRSHENWGRKGEQMKRALTTGRRHRIPLPADRCPEYRA